jgi:fatty acid desaturase
VNPEAQGAEAMPRPEQIRALSIPSSRMTWLALAFDWAMIAACFALAVLVPHPAVWIFCFLFMARQQLALAILMHDGAHRRMFKSAKTNDWVCQFLCAAPLFFSMYSYQRLHLKHHREPLAPDDPDLSLIGGYPIPWTSLVRKLLRDASGLSYIKFIRYFIHMSRKPKTTSPGNAKPEKDVGPVELKAQSGGSRLSLGMIALSILFVALTMWSALFWFGHGWYFLFFWVLPAVTFLQVLLRIRGIAEHAGYQAGPDQRLNARTVINPLQTFIFAPHHVNYHIEHHAYPAVPFYNLPELHRLMDGEKLIPAANVFFGYRQVLSDLIR